MDQNEKNAAAATGFLKMADASKGVVAAGGFLKMPETGDRTPKHDPRGGGGGAPNPLPSQTGRSEIAVGRMLTPEERR